MGWMSDNFLKLNEKKTDSYIIKLSLTFGGKCKLMSTVSFDKDYFIQPATSVKSLGVVLDDGLTFQKHIDKVIGVCYLNLPNMGRIALKLSRTLKIQLIHSLILSHIDYCNALFYNLLEYLLHKLTKVLYSAVCFVFGLQGSARCSHMLPNQQNLHILPVKFCIQYKIALLTYKCIYGTSLNYLQNLISYYPASSYNLRVSDNPLFLKIMSGLNYKKCESIFSCASSHVWNSLPLSSHKIESKSRFKKQLKCYYFSITFEHVNDI